MLLSKQIDSLHALNSMMAANYGICQPGYGRGKSASFDFAAIEYQLAVTLLTSVSHIATNPRCDIVVKPFEFAGEVLNRSLNLLSLIDKFVPQEPLDNLSTLRQSSANFLAEIKNGRALLALLEAVMFKCTKTRPSMDQLISEFCQVHPPRGAQWHATSLSPRSLGLYRTLISWALASVPTRRSICATS